MRSTLERFQILQGHRGEILMTQGGRGRRGGTNGGGQGSQSGAESTRGNRGIGQGNIMKRVENGQSVVRSRSRGFQGHDLTKQAKKDKLFNGMNPHR